MMPYKWHWMIILAEKRSSKKHSSLSRFATGVSKVKVLYIIEIHLTLFRVSSQMKWKKIVVRQSDIQHCVPLTPNNQFSFNNPFHYISSINMIQLY